LRLHEARVAAHVDWKMKWNALGEEIGATPEQMSKIHDLAFKPPPFNHNGYLVVVNPGDHHTRFSHSESSNSRF
jgi:hypothetical protein